MIQRLPGSYVLPILIVAVAVAIHPAGLRASESAGDSITIAHIAAGIEGHIDRSSRANGGFFKLDHQGVTLNLRLIRIHMEYLANLGDGVQFACVDLVGSDGTVYDVDFFLKGTSPDALSVTETHVHKLDGRPIYTWEQKPDGTWHRVAAEDAGEELLGVRRGEDRFTFTYRFTLPQLDGPAKIWLPLAQSDARQTVSVTSIRTPVPYRTLEEQEYGNKVLYLMARPEHGGDTIEIRYHVRRVETSPYDAAESAEALAGYLKPKRLVPINDTFLSLARKLTEGRNSDLMRARELYNHVVEGVRYARYGEGWGRGDAVYACNAGSGNCTDFHSYFIALARAAGIPARFRMGAAIPSERDDGGIDGYHCWAEFHAEGQWWPVDISEANKYTRLADYYFGKHPANRFELTLGRDLVVEPGPSSGPINFLAYPVVEVDGEPVACDRPVFEFQRLPAHATAEAAPIP